MLDQLAHLPRQYAAFSLRRLGAAFGLHSGGLGHVEISAKLIGFQLKAFEIGPCRCQRCFGLLANSLILGSEGGQRGIATAALLTPSLGQGGENRGANPGQGARHRERKFDRLAVAIRKGLQGCHCLFAPFLQQAAGGGE